MTKKSRKIFFVRDVKFDEASLGLSDVKNDYAPLYLEYDDQEDKLTPEEQVEEKKEASLEEDKISVG
jgi:hypothetical protein